VHGTCRAVPGTDWHVPCTVWRSLAARPEDCGMSARPPEIPPNEQECGLTNPTAP